ncbi:hypothetical protein HDU93_008963, partial [Gonapodya sp. JEL0774]
MAAKRSHQEDEPHFRANLNNRGDDEIGTARIEDENGDRGTDEPRRKKGKYRRDK